ncbi:hypothetical protein F4680DRAFT_11580 [Xylaria scruposa]|nr:hypothetical protein F4680DRAFT_11580 [Xylaria scruposa]
MKCRGSVVIGYFWRVSTSLGEEVVENSQEKSRKFPETATHVSKYQSVPVAWVHRTTKRPHRPHHDLSVAEASAIVNCQAHPSVPIKDETACNFYHTAPQHPETLLLSGM